MNKQKELTALTALLSGETPLDMQYKAHILSLLLARGVEGKAFSIQQLVRLGSRFPFALPASRMETLIRDMPIFEQEGDAYRIRQETDLAEWYRSKGFFVPKSVDLSITLDTLKSYLGEGQEEQAAWSVFDVRSAIRRGLDWCFLGVRVSRDDGGKGLPAFWSCNEHGLEPVGFTLAGTCHSDTLGALCGSLFGPVAMDLAGQEDHPELLELLLTYNLNCLVTPDQHNDYTPSLLEWNTGGFLPMEDQPGSFHPTVDATANFVIAAAMTYFFHDKLAEQGVPFHLGKQQLGDAILASLDFLLRQQLAGGAWGIYRYREDSYLTDPNPFSTALTVISLGLVKMSGVLDALSREELYGAINQRLLRTFAFLMDRRITYNGHIAWTMSFTDDTDRVPATEINGATMFCAKALFSMSRGMPELRDRIYPVLEEYVDAISNSWSPDYEALYSYDFRVPLESELNGTFNSWEIRYDVRLSDFLLNLHNESCSAPELDITLPPSIWNNIDITVGKLLKEQHAELGHWIDPINKRPFAVSTLFALETLQSYLQAVKLMLDNE